MAPRRRITLNEPLLKTNCTLGEGPLWDPRTGTLHFLDIEEKKLYHYHPESGDLKVDQFELRLGSLALRKSGGLACSFEHGFAVIENDPATGKAILRPLSEPLDKDVQKYCRFNDGACDSRGRYFSGTLAYPDPPLNGQLWRYDPADKTSVLVDGDGITDSNGLGWSEDDKTLYFTSTLDRRIYAYDYDIETGAATNRRIHIDTSSYGLGAQDYPDGFCIDSDGGIWSAQWAGSKVARFTPDGVYDLEISIPSAWHVTACCFGGPNMDHLYITTGSALLPEADPRIPWEVNAPRQLLFPNSGNIFMVDLKGEFREGKYRHEYLH